MQIKPQQYKETPVDENKILKALKYAARNVSSKTSMDEKQYQTNPYTVKAEILKNLGDKGSVSQVDTKAGGLFNVCITHDNQYALLAGFKVIIVIKLEDKSEYHRFKNAHYNVVKALVVTKDDSTMISCSNDGSIKMWNLKSKQLLHTFDKAHSQQIWCLALTPDDKHLVSGSGDSSAKVWDLDAKKCIGTIKPPPKSGEIFCLTVTNNGKHIVMGCFDKTISIWNFGTWDLVHHFKEAHLGSLVCIRVSQDDSLIFSGSFDGAIGVWDFHAKKNIHILANAHANQIWDIKTLHNDRFIVSASNDCTVGIFDTKAKISLYSFKTFGEEDIMSVDVTSDNRYIVAAGGKGNLHIIDLGKEEDPLYVEEAHANSIAFMQMTYDGKMVITAGEDGKISVWDLQTKELYHTFVKGKGNLIWSIAVSPDNRTIATGSTNCLIDIWDLGDKSHIQTCEQIHQGAIGYIIFSKDGSKIISCSNDWSIGVWDAKTYKLLGRVKNTHKSWALVADISNDGKWLLSGSMDKSIALWDLEDLQSIKLVYRIENAHESGIWRLKLTSDSKFLISCASERIKLWDLYTRRPFYTFETSQQIPIRNLLISKDDRFLYTINTNCLMEVYDIQTKQRIRINDKLAGARSLAATLTLDGKNIIIAKERSIYKLENRFTELTVQPSDEFSNYSLVRFMPFGSYFTTFNLIHRQKIIKSYPEFKVLPFGWNWFHIAALFSPSKEIIMSCFENKIPFIPDEFNKTPLHYLLKNQEADMTSINLILSRFETILATSQRPHHLLNSITDIILPILELDNVHVITFLKSCLREPEAEYQEVVDAYGKINGDAKASFYVSNGMIYSQQIRENLIDYSHKQKISIKLLPLSWCHSFTSDDMGGLVKTLRGLTTQGIFETRVVSLLITRLWEMSKRYHYFLGLLFSVQAVLISVYTAIGEKDLGLEIPIFVISVLFSGYELFEFASGSIVEHLTSLWNWVDIATITIVPATMIAVWSGVDGIARDWLFSLMLAFTYIRWVSYFRVFKQTRKLIRMIIEIILDIRGFATILAFIIFGLSLIFLQFDRETGYGMHLFNSYRLLYSDFDTDTMTSSGPMLAYFIIIIALVSIVLLNMLITIMGEKFAEVQQRSSIVESSEKLELIAENMKVFKSLRWFSLSRKKCEESEPHGYLFIAEQKIEEDDTIQQNVESQMMLLKEQFQNFSNQAPTQDSNLAALKLEERIGSITYQVNELKSQVAEHRQLQERHENNVEYQIAELKAMIEEQKDLQVNQARQFNLTMTKILRKLEGQEE